MVITSPFLKDLVTRLSTPKTHKNSEDMKSSLLLGKIIFNFHLVLH